jgi:hypothetical protein
VGVANELVNRKIQGDAETSSDSWIEKTWGIRTLERCAGVRMTERNIW